MVDKFLLHENITGFFLFEILEEEIFFGQNGTNTYEKIENLNKIVKLRSKLFFKESNFLKIYSQLSENILPVELVNFLRLNNVKFLFCDPSLHINLLNLGIRVGESSLISRGIRFNEEKILQFKNRIKWLKYVAEQKINLQHDFLIFYDEQQANLNKYKFMQIKLKKCIEILKNDKMQTEADRAQLKNYNNLYDEYDKIIEKKENGINISVNHIYPMSTKFTSPSLIVEILRIYKQEKIIAQLNQQKLSRLLNKFSNIGPYHLNEVKSEFFKRYASKLLILLRMDIYKQYDEELLNNYKIQIDKIYNKFKVVKQNNHSLLKKIKAKLFK